jgi:predicted HAD superfamily Cof-like phosphohydrolase
MNQKPPLVEQGDPLTAAGASQRANRAEMIADDRSCEYPAGGVAEMVAEFHAAFGLPIASIPTGSIPGPLVDLRCRLLAEEVAEFEAACASGDLVGILDGLADVVYVAYGTALTYGIDLNAAIAEVHRSNMSKLGEDGRPILRVDGKVLKGPQYSPPNLSAIVATAFEREIGH